MGNEVKIIISADGKTAVAVTQDIAEAYKNLGATSIAEVNKAKAEIISAYEKIKNSGSASAKEIEHAERAKNRAIKDLMDKNLAENQSITSKLKQHWLGISAAFASAAVITNFLKSSAVAAYEAEAAFNKLRIQVENLGYSYSALKGGIDSALQKTSEYAIVQEEQAAKSLQQMIFYSGDLGKSMQNLNLVYDLAYQKSISVEEASTMVGKAMTGNIEMLGRYFLEFRDINKTLGEHATEADKAAYALAVLQEKTKGASDQMTEHEKKVRRVNKAWQDLKETIGNFLLDQADDALNRPLQTLAASTKRLPMMGPFLSPAIDAYLASSAAEESISMVTEQTKKIEEQTLALKENAVQHGKTAKQIAEESKARSDAIEHQKKQDEANLKWYAAMMQEAEDVERRLKERATARLEQNEERKKLIDDGNDYMVKKYAESLGKLKQLDEEYIKIREQQYKQIWQEGFDMANQVGGDMGKGLGMMMGGVKGLSDIDAGIDPYSEQMRQLTDYYGAKTEAMYQQMEAELYFKEQAGAKEIELEQYKQEQLALIQEEWNNYSTQIEQQQLQQRLSMYQSYAGAMAGAMLALANTGTGIAKAAFGAYKAFAIAEVIIGTYRAAQAALNPPPLGLGPVFGAALAVAMTAAGMARVAAIAAQKPGGAISSAGVSGGGGYSYSEPSAPSWQKTEKEEPRPQIINVHVYGNIVDHDAFARELVPAIQKATADGVK